MVNCSMFNDVSIVMRIESSAKIYQVSLAYSRGRERTNCVLAMIEWLLSCDLAANFVLKLSRIVAMIGNTA
jgi:hypothetical protein